MTTMKKKGNTGSPRPTRFHLTRFTASAPFLFFLKKFKLRDSLTLHGDRSQQTEPEYSVLF